MKKIFAILLVVLLAISIVACDKKPVEPAPSEPGETNAPTDKVYNVVSLVNGNLGDKSFFDSAEAGLKKLASDGRITYKTIEMGGTDADQPKWQETLDEVAQTGEYDLIVCGTYQMPDFLKETATNYPDQKFLIYDDNTYVGENQNVVILTYRQNDMGYLIGVFAALMTSETDLNNINAEKVVGFIGGID
ncbi:MAG: BMP family ABC transporter substrate-binding protein, partial [Eubacteriales bacterium]|nr:BMP family ABC transporter substrate-binding protein [Eubacteriales bacterium]